jgi:F0F1-type ATP synthase assembly protein I
MPKRKRSRKHQEVPEEVKPKRRKRRSPGKRTRTIEIAISPYILMGLGFGLAFGLLLSAMFGSYPLGIGLGIIFGIAAGLGLNQSQN